MRECKLPEQLNQPGDVPITGHREQVGKRDEERGRCLSRIFIIEDNVRIGLQMAKDPSHQAPDSLTGHLVM
jgi:hypothetical protein